MTWREKLRDTLRNEGLRLVVRLLVTLLASLGGVELASEHPVVQPLRDEVAARLSE